MPIKTIKSAFEKRAEKRAKVKEFKSKLNKTIERMAREGKIKKSWTDITGVEKAHNQLIKKYKKSL